MFTNKRILVTGGTGSLGKTLVRRLLSAEEGKPKKVIVFSRDEAKQHEMRMLYKNMPIATDEIIYKNAEEILDFHIGDVRSVSNLSAVLRNVDIVFNAAALKQVPTCEYFPYEAVLTNITGVENIVRVIKDHCLPVKTVVGISTDKACKPINVMGMSKAIQERIFINANLNYKATRFICVRYGNVIASRGSVIPLFLQQIRLGGPVTITSTEMTRFLISLESAVDTIFAAVKKALPGETYIPKIRSANVVDIVDVLMGHKKIKKVITGIRPGEKLHEILVSEEECLRTIERDGYFVIQPLFREIRSSAIKKMVLKGEFSSADYLFKKEDLKIFFKKEKLLDYSSIVPREELLK
ncbi:MAG: polysaccharide biosynthesis protein [bacterium]|nr:polysaccharide biosynthesis protein [bacterium]